MLMCIKDYWLSCKKCMLCSGSTMFAQACLSQYLELVRYAVLSATLLYEILGHLP